MVCIQRICLWAGHAFFRYWAHLFSALASIVFILSFKNYKVLFLLCVIPYLMDFVLIMTYPKRLNEKRVSNATIKGFYKTGANNR